MRHGAATQMASSRAGICTQNLRDSRALSLRVRRSPPHPRRTGKCSFCLQACGGSWGGGVCSDPCKRAQGVTVFEERVDA